jgi:hypothetical protein
MEKLIKYLQETYGNEITSTKAIGKAELQITIGSGVNVGEFSQSLQDHIVEHINDMDIVKIDIVDADGNLKDSFATNQ